MKRPSHSLHLTAHQTQKGWRRYLRLVQDGLYIKIGRSIRAPDPVAVLVPHDWFVEATDLDVWELPSGRLGIEYSQTFYERALAPLVAHGLTAEEAFIRLCDLGLDFTAPRGSPGPQVGRGIRVESFRCQARCANPNATNSGQSAAEGNSRVLWAEESLIPDYRPPSA